ncbi:hypothetical protein J2X14_000541 [Pantoea alhagi]|nr:hypothetical protein [Pantoea alhagi]
MPREGGVGGGIILSLSATTERTNITVIKEQANNADITFVYSLEKDSS